MPTQDQMFYDIAGRVISQTDPSASSGSGVTTFYGYDDLGRTVVVTQTAGACLSLTSRTLYDKLGNVLVSTDPNGVATGYEYDHLNRLTAVMENYKPPFVPDASTNVRTEYAYDAQGNRTQVATRQTADGEWHITQYAFDPLGRQISETDPLAHTTVYTYSLSGQPATMLDAKHNVINYGYDGLNRLTGIDYPAGTADVAFGYDALSRPITITQPFTNPVSYAYDQLGNRSGLKYPDGREVAYTYDPLNRLEQVQVAGGQVAGAEYSYNLLGQPITTTLPNGVQTVYGYDALHRLTSLTHTGITGTLASYVYALDAVGNRTAVTETVRQPGDELQTTTISYTYDSLYRLTDAVYSSGEEFHYTYDAVGNRLSEEISTQTTTYAYDAANRLITSQVEGQPAVPYTWDDNGNLISDVAHTYTYDAANRLISATGGGTTSSYQYNGLGDRVSQTVNDVTTQYALDLNVGLTQVLADGHNTYLYGIDLLGEIQPAGLIYHLPDALGSVRQLADAQANLTLSQSFEPFGSTRTSAGTGHSIFGYAGEAKDANGLIFLRARYYNSIIGRFFSRDAWAGNVLMPATLHAYLYGLNNPIMYADPSGRCFGFLGGTDTVLCGAMIGAAIGGVAGVASTYAGQVVSSLASGKTFAEALKPTDGNAIIAAGVGGAVQGGICGAVAVASFGTGLAVCGAVGGAAGGAVNQLTYDLLNGGLAALQSQNTWTRTGFASIQGGVVGLATFGLANKVPGLKLPPAQVAFGGGVSGVLQFAGNVFDDDPTTQWNYELGPSVVRGATSVIVSQASFAAARAICLKSSASSRVSLEEIFSNPRLLDGKSPAEVQELIQQARAQGWQVGTLSKGSHEGQGLKITEINQNGDPTDRMITWHPGGGHHGSNPYWKISSADGGTTRVGPQFPSGGNEK